MRRFIMRFPTAPMPAQEEFDTFEELASRLVRRYSETDLIDVYEATPVFSVPNEQRYTLVHLLTISSGGIIGTGHFHYAAIYNDIREHVKPEPPNPTDVFNAYR